MCTHDAAVFFALDDLTSRGIQTLPEDPASTGILCTWTDPKGSKPAPKILSDVSFIEARSHRSGEPTKKKGQKGLCWQRDVTQCDCHDHGRESIQGQ